MFVLPQSLGRHREIEESFLASLEMTDFGDRAYP
jgi:hypothetical protein